MKTLSGLCALLFFATASVAGAVGGEIGNALVHYENRLGNYELDFPRDWSQVEMEALSSFNEPSSAPGRKFFSVLADRFPGVQTLGDLERHLRFFQPTVTWAPVSQVGLEGFQGDDRGVRIVYLLRHAEDLVSIRYSVPAAGEPAPELREMLNSLKVF